ncbi:DUF2690 domain-containing protein [Streptomyces sp. NPDC091212]|uniref:helix-turn-helix domain-containing protein n=1 Tax=Streptomyces sp. NPDC091212 TaxID=3155191 RepID=UPI003441D758
MPRWKALPEELDPEVSEFTSQLRALVDRSGLSIAAVADRTGYSKTSWERYLNGRMLAPKGAIVALADVTGTHQGHLTTMWELAERAWSRSEMRHDMTMEAIRISQARMALGEFSPGAAGSTGAAGGPGTAAAPGKTGKGGPGTAAGSGARVPGATVDFGAGPAARRGAPGVPQQRGPGTRAGLGGAGGPGGQGGPSGPGGYSAPGYGPTAAPGQGQGPGQGPGQGSAGKPKSGRGRMMVFAAGVVGALLVIGAALLLTDIGGDGRSGKAVAQSPSASPSPSKSALPAGVKCGGDDCTGKDPEEMGCGGEFAETVSNATVGTSLIEVRYSKTCGAAWARITQAAVGDEVRISSLRATGEEQAASVEVNTTAYTTMAAVPDAESAKACATLAATGVKGCTTGE